MTHLRAVWIPNTLSCSLSFGLQLAVLNIRFRRFPLDVLELCPASFEKLGCEIKSSNFSGADITLYIIV